MGSFFVQWVIFHYYVYLGTQIILDIASGKPLQADGAVWVCLHPSLPTSLCSGPIICLGLVLYFFCPQPWD